MLKLRQSIPMGWSSSSISKYIAAGIIAVAVILALASVWHDSIIIDEDPHIGAGYSYLTQQDMRLNPEHPPLAKDLAAVPLLFLDLRQDAFASRFWQNDVNGQWDFGRRLIFNSGLPAGQAGNNADLITHAAKVPMLALFVISALLIFRWTRERYGKKAALLALVLFCFSPTVMAHARFVTTDVAALTGVVAATYTFLRYLSAGGGSASGGKETFGKNFWLASVVFGLALMAKFSTILLIPFFIILALIWQWRMLWRTILIMIAGFVLIVGPVYYFHVFNEPPARQRHDTEDILRSFGNRMLANPVVWMSDKPILRAYAQYGLGLLMVVQRSAGGNTVYYRGEVLNTGGPGYFPFVYLIKEPLPWLILLVIAVIIAISKFKTLFKIENLKLKIDEIAMLLWLAIYWATSIHSTLNIGVRHLLPVYPFMIILVSGQIVMLFRKRLIFEILSFILLGWYVAENLLVYPYYLTYFNELAGGPSGGHRYVVDSNLDWGQDLRRFADWVKTNNIKKIELDYFGWADQSYYLGNRFEWLTADKYKSAEDFVARNDTDGWIAVSATFLMNNYKTKYAWLYSRTPVTIIGNSIFIYRVL